MKLPAKERLQIAISDKLVIAAEGRLAIVIAAVVVVSVVWLGLR